MTYIEKCGLVVVAVSFLLFGAFVALCNANEGPITRLPRTFDVVLTPDNVPEGSCRYVQFLPDRPVRVSYPSVTLMCDTLGAVGIVDHK